MPLIETKGLTYIYSPGTPGNLLTNTTLLENHYNDYYFGVMQIEPPFEENEEVLLHFG